MVLFRLKEGVAKAINANKIKAKNVEKAQFTGVNEHFEAFFNENIESRIGFAKVSKIKSLKQTYKVSKLHQAKAKLFSPNFPNSQTTSFSLQLRTTPSPYFGCLTLLPFDHFAEVEA